MLFLRFLQQHFVLQGSGGQTGKGKRISVVMLLLATNIDDTDQLTDGIEDRGRSAGQEVIGVKIMLFSMHSNRFSLCKGYPDRIRSFSFFSPVGSHL